MAIGNIDEGARRFPNIGVVAVANNADDLHIEGARTATEFHKLAECLAIGEIFLRESLVDDGDFGAGLIVGGSEFPAPQKRDPEIRKM